VQRIWQVRCTLIRLSVVIFLRGYLSDGAMQRQLWSRVLRLLLFIGAIYGVSYGVLCLLSRDPFAMYQVLTAAV
jgi:hypothetical protein